MLVNTCLHVAAFSMPLGVEHNYDGPETLARRWTILYEKLIRQSPAGFVDAVDAKGSTALMLACGAGNVLMTRALLNCAADPNIVREHPAHTPRNLFVHL